MNIENEFVQEAADELIGDLTTPDVVLVRKEVRRRRLIRRGATGVGIAALLGLAGFSVFYNESTNTVDTAAADAQRGESSTENNQTEPFTANPEDEAVTTATNHTQDGRPASEGQPPLGDDELKSPASGLGVPCAQQPRPNIGPDASVDPDRRGEALVLHLTGFDELAITEESEGGLTIYDDPNYGGVYGDLNGGWVVAVLDCSLIDADEIAALAGGADSVTLIEVPYSFDDVNDFSDQLSAELADLDIPSDVRIESTLRGRHIRVTVEEPRMLPGDFGREIPSDAFTVEEGEAPSPG